MFLTSGAARDIKLTWVDGELVVERARIVKDYMSIPPYRGLAIPGQPAKQVIQRLSFYALLVLSGENRLHSICFPRMQRDTMQKTILTMSRACEKKRFTITAISKTCLLRSSKPVSFWTNWRNWHFPKEMASPTRLSQPSTSRRYPS